MLNAFSKNRQSGASIAELLIVAPVVSLLVYVIFDANRRIDDGIDVTNASRVAAYFGEIKIPSENNRSYTVEKVNEQAKGSTTANTDGQKESDHSARTSHPSDLTMLGAGASTYKTVSEGIDTALSLTDVVAKPVKGLLSAAVDDKLELSLRSADVSLVSQYQNDQLTNGMKSLSTLIDKNADLDFSTRHFDQGFVKSLNGFHSNSYNRPSILGLALGMAFGSHWGTTGSYGKNADSFLARCMTRLSMDNSCESPKVIYKDRVFLKKIHTIATVRIAISAIIAVFTLGSATVAEEGLKAVVDELINQGVNSIMDTVTENLKKKLMESIEKSMIDANKLNDVTDLSSLTDLENKIKIDDVIPMKIIEAKP